MKARLSLTLLLLAAPAAHAQQISADRPGVGSDPEVAPQFVLQPEMGTDGREIRIGVAGGVEIDRDEDNWAAKFRLADNDTIKTSVKLSRKDDTGRIGIEVPLNVAAAHWLNVTLDAQMYAQRSSNVYAAEFNFAPTGRLTITPTLYRDTKTRAALFGAWVPFAHDNIQLDIGYYQHRAVVGISAAIDFSDILKQKVFK